MIYWEIIGDIFLNTTLILGYFTLDDHFDICDIVLNDNSNNLISLLFENTTFCMYDIW